MTSMSTTAGPHARPQARPRARADARPAIPPGAPPAERAAHVDDEAASAHGAAGASTKAPAHAGSERVESARLFVRRTARSLDALSDALDESFARAVTLLDGARRIVVTGVGKSGLVGAKIAATLSSTGSPSHFLHATEAAHGDLGIVTEEDAVLAISNSGDSTELGPIVAYCRRFSVPLIGVTSKRRSSLGRRADVLLVLPPEPEAGPIASAPMTSTTMTLVLGDALAAALIEAKGFRPEDFHKFHPGGKLGAQTMRLSRLIEEAGQAEDGNPRAGPHPMSVVAVTLDASVEEVIDAIGYGGRGIVGVRDEEAGRIVGIVTDGDIRRAVPAMRGGAELRAADIMHRDPIHLRDTALVADALATCEENRISGVFVTDADDRVRAVVHIQDLLRVGAI